MLRLELLGEFRALEDGVPIEALAPRRLQLLVAYLVLHAGTPLPRHSVAFGLWPESPEQQALTNLRNLLHLLRRALPDAEQHLEIRQGSIGWRTTSDASVDVFEFERCVERAPDNVESLERAAAIPHGDLLSHFDDEWIAPHRSRLRGLLLGALDRLADTHAEHGDCAGAISVVERRLRIDRFSEEAHRRLIELHLQNDDRGAALLAYHACVRMLAEDFGAEPTPRTRRLSERLLGGGDRGAFHSEVGMTPREFVGRSAEWQRLQDTWSEAASGSATAMLVLGEAGMGKTRLVREFLTHVADTRLTEVAPLVLEARAYPTGERLPYAPLLDWLRSPSLATRYTKLATPDLTELARFVPELREAFVLDTPSEPIADAWGRQRAFEAIAAALVSPDRPTLLFLDDLQWADGDTLDFLVYALERRADARLLVLATARTEALVDDGAAASWRGTLAARGRLDEIELGPFNRDETEVLANQVLPQRPSDAAIQQLFDETEGHPLFILETLRAGGPQVVSDAEPRARPVPRTIRSVIREHLRLLSAEGVQMAGAAAVIGRVFSPALLRQTADVSEETLVRGLDELWARRVVREQESGTYDFTHDRLREIAYSDVAPARRRALHRRAALALEATEHAPHAEVAYHFERAGGTVEAARHFILAGQAARRVYANAEALKHYRSALHAWPDGADLPLDRPATEQEVGDLELLAGRVDEAEAAYQRALSDPRMQPLRAAIVHRKRGSTFLFGRQFERARGAFDDAETDMSRADRGDAWESEWIDLQSARMELHYWLGEPSIALDIARDLEPLVPRGTQEQRLYFLLTLGVVLLRHSRFAETEEAIRRLDEALEIASNHPSNVAYALFICGFARVWARDLDAAERLLLEGLALCEERGELLVRDRCLSYLALTSRFRGNVGRTREWALRSMESATQVGTADYVAMAQAHLGWCCWRERDTPNAVRLFEEARVQWRQYAVTAFEWPFQWAALWPLLAIRLEEGDLGAALECAATLLDSRHIYLGEAIESQLRQSVASEENDAVAMSALRRALDLAREQSWL